MPAKLDTTSSSTGVDNSLRTRSCATSYGVRSGRSTLRTMRKRGYTSCHTRPKGGLCHGEGNSRWIYLYHPVSYF